LSVGEFEEALAMEDVVAATKKGELIVDVDAVVVVVVVVTIDG
jgi:hypothetical protein